ncbi:hypothetical protein BAE44_0005432 [Dichanthelium oligosanthes]|uniref:Uncharacterized protein n=1 Tax=Dichanthelium oligosanthes TaxID=888268 RepID=A0A1E5W8H8_9POAL|nr:hypothetical protein BAE44_0005432 [Dichanthelium oligosanthes]
MPAGAASPELGDQRGDVLASPRVHDMPVNSQHWSKPWRPNSDWPELRICLSVVVDWFLRLLESELWICLSVLASSQGVSWIDLVLLLLPMETTRTNANGVYCGGSSTRQEFCVLNRQAELSSSASGQKPNSCGHSEDKSVSYRN